MGVNTLAVVARRKTRYPARSGASEAATAFHSRVTDFLLLVRDAVSPVGAGGGVLSHLIEAEYSGDRFPIASM